MSQLDFIRDTSSDFFDALVASDLADAGTYTPPGVAQTPVPCRVLLRRGVVPFGEFGRVAGQALAVRLVNADVPAQARDGIVEVTSTALGVERFKLLEQLEDNGAVSTWSVIRA